MGTVTGNLSWFVDVDVVWLICVPYYTEGWMFLRWGIVESSAFSVKISLTSERCWQAGSQLSSVICEICKARKDRRWWAWILKWCCQAPGLPSGTSVFAVVILSLWAAPLKDHPRPCMSLHGLGCIHIARGYYMITELPLSRAVFLLWDSVLYFLVFWFRESEIVITEIEMVMN